MFKNNPPEIDSGDFFHVIQNDSVWGLKVILPSYAWSQISANTQEERYILTYPVECLDSFYWKPVQNCKAVFIASNSVLVTLQLVPIRRN